MKSKLSEKQYLHLAKEKFCQVLKEVPFVADVEIKDTGFQRGFGDFVAAVRYSDGDGVQLFCVDVRSNGEKRFVNAFMLTASQHKDGDCYVFMAPYISDVSATSLIDGGYSFMDLSGNCYIASDRVFIHLKGCENKFLIKKDKTGYFSRSSSAASVILRTMLEDPSAVWKVKDLSVSTGKAIGTVSNVKNFLVDRDLAEELPCGFKLKNVDSLLHAWSNSYRQKESLTFEYYSMDPLSDIEEKISSWSKAHGYKAILGGFSAAARYAPTVRYKKVALYVDIDDCSGLVRDLGLMPVDSGGNVIITVPHDETPCLFWREVNGDPVTSPVQTAIDLLCDPSRGEEAAEAVILKEFAHHDQRP